MTEQIISRDTIRARARRAFAAGKGRDDHEMNWHSAALLTWLHEYDRLAAQARPSGERRFFKQIGEGQPA